MQRCYANGGEDFDLESLGDEEWLTGCPLCGGSCWDLPKDEKDEIDKELDSEN
jgi:hypothetical protein